MPPSVIAISEIAVSDNCRISSSVTLRICDDICSRNARMTLPTPSPVCVGQAVRCSIPMTSWFRVARGMLTTISRHDWPNCRW